MVSKPLIAHRGNQTCICGFYFSDMKHDTGIEPKSRLSCKIAHFNPTPPHCYLCTHESCFQAPVEQFSSTSRAIFKHTLKRIPTFFMMCQRLSTDLTISAGEVPSSYLLRYNTCWYGYQSIHIRYHISMLLDTVLVAIILLLSLHVAYPNPCT